MTARQLYNAVLIELGKIGAPSLLLEEFNYFAQKAINQIINKSYNVYGINQQYDDNLRVLKATSILTPTNDHEVFLPLDYVHLLKCICEFEVQKKYKCYNKNSLLKFSATRLTPDLEAQIINNYYLTPKITKPYYYINNINSSIDLPTNPITDTILERTTIGTDINRPYDNENSNLPRKISLKNFLNKDSIVEKEIGVRYGNSSSIRMEIRYQDDDRFQLKHVIIDYLKAPQTIKLTQEQINLVKDTSQILEFPDYVCQEIVNELVTLMMANIADPRINTQMVVQQSIANPIQQQKNKN